MLSSLRDFISRNPHVLGGGDIVTLRRGGPAVRAGMLAAVIAGVIIKDEGPAIRRFVFLVPHGDDVGEAARTIREHFIVAYESLSGQTCDDGARQWVEKRLIAEEAKSGRFEAVVDVLSALPERAALIVLRAERYRDDGIEPFIPQGATTPLANEDVWVPQVTALAARAVAAIGARQVYFALDADELGPVRPELDAMLKSVDRCGVMGETSETFGEPVIGKRVDEWDRWISEGHVGLALRDISALPSSIDAQKPFLSIQIMAKAGLRLQALETIRGELARGHDFDPSARVKLARIAADAGADRLANDLLSPVRDQLDGREDLESALKTLESTGADGLADHIAARLDARFPGAEGTKRWNRLKKLRAGDYAGLATLWRGEDDPRADFFEKLGAGLQVVGVPDYLGLIEGFRDAEQSDRARLASVEDALSRGLVIHAFELVLYPVATDALLTKWDAVMLDVIKRCFIDGDHEGNLPVPLERVASAVNLLLQRLAANPLNGVVRAGIVDLLRPNIAGTAGVALMAMVALGAAAEPIKLRKGFRFGSTSMDWLTDHEAFATQAFNWLEGESPIIMGKLALPKELLTVDPDEAVTAIAHYLELAPISDESDVHSLQIYLALASAIAPYTSDPNLDLRLTGLVAGKLISNGLSQQGRDLVECAIQSSAQTPARRRLAWFAVADAYHRSRDHLTALVALTVAFLTGNEADEEQVWLEIYALARVLRDIGLVDLALRTVSKGQELLNRMGLAATYGHRLDLLALQIRQRSLARGDAAELASLLNDAFKVAEEVLANRHPTAPVALTLGQLMREGRRLDVVIPERADEVFAELAKWAGGNLNDLVAATSVKVPTVEQIEKLVGSLPRARYAEDVGFDTATVATLAGLALTDDEVLNRAPDASFLLETLADWGTALPGWDEAAAPPRIPTRSAPAEIAAAIAKTGTDVLQLGFDANGTLVRLMFTADGAEAAVREDPLAFSEAALRAWSAEFPHRYGLDDSANLFYTTTEQLQLSAAPSRSTLVVAATDLQAFPANILFADGEFLGRRQPVAAVPSLAWLEGARESNWSGDGRHVGWASAGEGETGTLALLVQLLAPTLDRYGFTLDTGARLPKQFAGATMAVVTAHGGVHPEGRYFQVVSDEGQLRVSAGELAAALRNVAVVILFVCSGGRADKHPGANTTLGLAKQLLDRGSRAVIASPWPLDSQVPPNWLPTFLDHWSRGETLMAANFAANAALDKRYSFDPARAQAMSVYGDGLMLRRDR